MAKIPKGFHSEVEGTKFRIFGVPRYYKDDAGTLKAIEGKLVSSKRSGYKWEVVKGLYKLWIKEDGTWTFNHRGDERSFKPVSIITERLESKTEKGALDFTKVTPTVTDNSIKWTLANGVVYEIIYLNHQLRDKITIPEDVKEAYIGSLLVAEKVDTLIGIKYDVSVDDEKCDVVEPNDERDAIYFKEKTSKIRPHRIRSDTINAVSIIDKKDNIDVFQRRRKLTATEFVDKVPVNGAEYEKDISFNTTIVFGDHTDATTGYTGTQDTWIWNYALGSQANRNFGDSDEMFIGSSFQPCRPLIAFNLKEFDDNYPDILAANINSIEVNIYVKTVNSGGPGTCDIYGVLQDYGTASGDWDVDEGTGPRAGSANSGEVCYNYRRHNTVSWNTAGCAANSSGVDGDYHDPPTGTDYDGSDDRGAQSLANTSLTSDTTWETWSLSSTGMMIMTA